MGKASSKFKIWEEESNGHLEECYKVWQIIKSQNKNFDVEQI